MKAIVPSDSTAGYVMRTAEECRVKARAMHRLSLASAQPFEREVYAALADGWRVTAKLADRQDGLCATATDGSNPRPAR